MSTNRTFTETKTHEVTVDVVILTIIKNKLKVLLLKRTNEPFRGRWSIPGGFIRLSENLDDAALRVLKEKTNVQNIYLEQLYTFGDPLRYPNTRVITCAYYALIRAEDIDVKITDESGASQIEWHSVEKLPPKRTRERLELCPIAFQLLPKKFTLTELQKSYELILKKELDKRNFRKKMLASNILIELNEFSKAGSKRPAALYSFDSITLDSKRGHFFS